MKKFVTIIGILIATFVQAQTTVHNSQVKINDVPQGVGTDTLVLVQDPNTKLIKWRGISQFGSGGGGAETDPVFATWLSGPYMNGNLNMNGFNISSTPGSFATIDFDNVYTRELIAYDAGGYGFASIAVQESGPNQLWMNFTPGEDHFNFESKGYFTNVIGDFRLNMSNNDIDAAHDSTLVNKIWVQQYVQNNAAGGSTDDQTASEVPFAPYLSLGSVNTQAAIQELKDEIDAGIGAPAETDPIFSAWNRSTGILITEAQISDLEHTVDTDTKLTEAEVDAYVANNGYITSVPTETDPVFSAWNRSSGITITESQISDLSHTVDTDTKLTEAEVDAFVANNGYLTSAPAETDPVFAASPAANTTGVNTGDQDLTPFETKALRSDASAGAYTTAAGDIGKEIKLTSGSVITLDDAGIPIDWDATFFNNTGGTITFAFGSGDAAIQGTPNDLEHGQYAYASLKAANTWSVMVGGSASTGSTTISGLSDVTLSSPTLNDVIAYDGTKWINQAIPGATETDPVFQAWNKSTGISITESQISNLNHTVDTKLTEAEVDAMVANNGYITSAGSDDQTASEVPFTPTGNTTSTNVQNAIVELQTELDGIGGAGAETDPVFTAWDRSTGISITESQISNLNHTVNTDDQTATEVFYNSANETYLNSNNVQDAIAELYNETVRLDPVGGHVYLDDPGDDEFQLSFRVNNQTKSYFKQSMFNTYSVFDMRFEDGAGAWNIYNGTTKTMSTSTINGKQLVTVPENDFANMINPSADGRLPSYNAIVDAITIQDVFSAMPYTNSIGNPTTSITYSPSKGKNNEFIDVDNASNITITLGINGTVDKRVVRFLQEGTGTITFAPGTGLTLLSPNGLTTSQGQIATVYYYHHNRAVVTIQ